MTYELTKAEKQQIEDAVKMQVKNMMAIHISKSSYCIGTNGNIMNRLMSNFQLLREDEHYWVIDGNYYNETYENGSFETFVNSSPGEYHWKVINQGYVVSEGNKSSAGFVVAAIERGRGVVIRC